MFFAFFVFIYIQSIYMRLRDKRILIDIFRKIRPYDLNLGAYFIFNILAKFDNLQSRTIMSNQI
jgi:hypothetical protein